METPTPPVYKPFELPMSMTENRYQSATTGKLFEALAKAQGQMKNPPKDRTAKIGNSHSYSYADLATSIDTNRAVLAANGLIVTQLTRMHVDFGFHLVTILGHLSGEWLSSTYPLPTEGKPQEIGSAITYARRYSYSAITGVASEEDEDGTMAQNKAPAALQPARTQAQGRPAPLQPASSTRTSPIPNENYMITWGKFKDKPFGMIKPSEMEGYFKYLRDTSNPKGTLGGAAQQLLNAWSAYTASKVSAPPMREPGDEPQWTGNPNDNMGNIPH